MNLTSGDAQQLSHVMGGAIKPAQVGDQIFYQDYTARVTRQLYFSDQYSRRIRY
jgi:hypothetical protein